MHAKNSNHITKVTYDGRDFTVKTSQQHGASVKDAKALGGWSDSGSFWPCYTPAFVRFAIFNGRESKEYFVGRACTGKLTPCAIGA
jgi:hypothetical protein